VIEESSYPAGVAQNANYSRFYPMAGTLNAAWATEASIQTMIRDTFTASNLFVYVMANSVTASSTFRTRKNGANGNLTVSVGTSQTGAFEDTTHSDSLTSGDLYAYLLTTGSSGSSMTITIIAVTLSHASDWKQVLVASASGTGTSYNTTASIAINGLKTGSATESYVQFAPQFAGTLSYLRGYVSTNSINGSSTLKTRKNTGDGAQSVSIGASATGSFEDTSNTDSFVSGDLLNYQLVTGGTSGSMVLPITQTLLASGHIFMAEGSSSSSSAATSYISLAGDYYLTTTKARAQITSRITLTRKNLYVRVNTNSRNGDLVVTSQLGAGDGNLTATVPSSTTGVFQDTVNSDSISSGDAVCTKLVLGGSSGSILLGIVSTEDFVAASENIDVSDSGTADDTSITLQEALDLTEIGAGTDGVAADEPQSIIETGAGSEAVTLLDAEPIDQTDSGAGTDQITSIIEGLSQTDSGAGTETPTINDNIPIADTGAGGEAVGAAEMLLVADSGSGDDQAFYYHYVDVSDSGLGVDTVYLVQGEISLDEVALPHVLSVTVEEPSLLQELDIMDALPYRKQYGKRGRSLRIQGWTDSLTTLETLRDYADGERHLLLLPTGDSMSVHVTDVQTPEDVKNYDRYDYTLTAVEVVD
jgi:hypothetical protein